VAVGGRLGIGCSSDRPGLSRAMMARWRRRAKAAGTSACSLCRAVPPHHRPGRCWRSDRARASSVGHRARSAVLPPGSRLLKVSGAERR
jgi:hypothetical protein